MENKKIYFAKKYFKDNWLQMIAGYIISIAIVLVLSHLFQVEDNKIILAIVIVINFLSDVVSFIRYMLKSKK